MVAGTQRPTVLVKDDDLARGLGELRHVRAQARHPRPQRGFVRGRLVVVRGVGVVAVFLQLASPEPAEVQVVAAVLVGQQRRVDRVAALDRPRLGLERPFGPVGDLRLVPDPDSAGFRIPGVSGEPDLLGFLCDIVETDGTPWGGCGRGFAKRALIDLEREFGLTIKASFEHEFVLTNAVLPKGAFTLTDFRAVQGFLGAVIAVIVGLLAIAWLIWEAFQ